ncbi:MAG: DHHW family protein [Butyrivibrio sp.]
MKKENLITVILFLTVIFGLGGAFWIVKDRDFSENENRYLAKAPEITMKSVLDGKFMDRAEDYVSDQFVLRDGFMAAASTLQRAAGKQDINGVYVGKDGYLISKTEERDVDRELFESNIKSVNSFFEKCDISGKKVMMIIPTASLVLEDRLPANAPEFDQTEAISQICEGISGGTVIDVTDCLMADEAQTYYKTDHHWTTYGAYDGYRRYCELYGRSVGDSSKNWITVTENFRGSLYSKVLLPGCEYDDIVAVPEPSCSVICDCMPGNLYHYEALSAKDKYNFFLGGNYGKVEIKGNGTGNLLVIKDSFANCFVPFLIDDYAEITMIDLRYYMGSPKALLDGKSITDVLVLYNISNFREDENIIKLGL